jgi:hypothetical protein
MAISNRTAQVLRESLADLAAAQDLVTALNGAASPQAPVVPVVITYTASASSYTPVGTLTIANGGTPTNTELLELCLELKRNITQLEAVLVGAGIVS